MARKSSLRPLGIGIIGCGNISTAYFKHTQPFSEKIKIVACADLDIELAKRKAGEHGIAEGCSVPELLENPAVDIVLNLTIPAAHASVNEQALEAGKHVYCEKPFSLSYKEGLRVLKKAEKWKLFLGCAPDTVLGGGIQTCRKLIDDGAIGKPIAATANMLCHGHEHWHPNPAFYYQDGGGPLFDMGPYYLTSLVNMLGPVRNVSAKATTTFQQRFITSQPLSGRKIKVNTPTHLSGILEFVGGAVATVTMSFDIWAHHIPKLEIYGTKGSLQCSDPNEFDGEIILWTAKSTEWRRIPLTHNDQVGRGVGVADMADAIQRGQVPRASGELGLHIVEIMESFLTSSRLERAITLKSTCSQPRALPAGLPLGKLS